MVQILRWSNRTQCCQQLATAATFLQVEPCCPGAMTRRWTPQTCYTLPHNTASIMKDLILILCHVQATQSSHTISHTHKRIMKKLTTLNTYYMFFLYFIYIKQNELILHSDHLYITNTASCTYYFRHVGSNIVLVQ